MKKTLSIILILSVLPVFSGGKTEKRISFAAVGDNLIHQSVYKSAFVGAGFDFSPIYANVANFIQSADVAFVNQETMLGTENYSGYPRFCSPVEAGDALVLAGFDVINISNNHSLDAGEAGFLFTQAYLSSIAECVTGDGGVRIVERSGIKIAFLSYTYATNCGTSACVSRFDERAARRDMEEARSVGDIVVVSMHWGNEFDTGRHIEKFEPTEKQIFEARLLTALGADVIIGSHPHVLERAEWIEAGGRRAFCAYSLGNFVSNMRYGAENLGGILTFDIVKDGRGARIENPKIIPTVCHYDMKNRSHTVFFLADYTNALASLHGTNKEQNERAFTKEYLTELYRSNIDPEFFGRY